MMGLIPLYSTPVLSFIETCRPNKIFRKSEGVTIGSWVADAGKLAEELIVMNHTHFSSKENQTVLHKLEFF